MMTGPMYMDLGQAAQGALALAIVAALVWAGRRI
jgi:hypothetical protein